MKISIIAISTLLFLASCNKTGESRSEEPSANMKLLKQQAPSTDTSYFQQAPQSPDRQKKDQQHDQPQPVKTDWDKKIIKTATLNAEVKDFKAFSQNLSQKVKGLGGYMSSEQQHATDYKIETAVSIKVPVAQFDLAVNELLKEVTTINEKQMSSADVTTEYIDSKSRMEAKKQVRLRYLELLKGARNMSDILSVQKEINEIQEEIEMVAGRINYLGHSSAMSTINFTFYQVLDPAAKDTGDLGFLSKFKNAFAGGWYWLGELVIGIVAIWPLLLLAALCIVFFRRRGLLKLK